MDFSFSEEQEAVFGLAKQVFKDQVTPERLRACDEAGEGIDRKLWAALAHTGLLGCAIPDEHGGSGGDLVALCQLLRAAGRFAAPVPLWPTLALGALPLAEFGSTDQKQWLAEVVAGEAFLTAALVEAQNEDVFAPQTQARLAGGGWTLSGEKLCVPAAHLAKRVLVPAWFEGGVGLFWIDPSESGVRIERQIATSGEPQGQLILDGAAAEPLGEPSRGAEILGWMLPRATVALCAHQLGIVEHALVTTAKYTSERQQFDRPIATFQAVSQRAADAYIDVQAIELTMWQAAWRLSAGLPAADQVDMAKLWAAEAGHRVTYAAQHLHGGIGFDLDYPLARYYTLAKTNELTLGSGTRHLQAIGARMAAATGVSPATR